MNNLSSILEDNAGGYSATRLAFLLWAIGTLVVWVHASWNSAAPVKLDDSVMTILGILMTGKVVQRFAEKPDQPAAPGGAGSGRPAGGNGAAGGAAPAQGNNPAPAI